jgi:solute:Na+ symporter, SSS family
VIVLSGLPGIDNLILISYLIIVLSLGLYYSRTKEKNGTEYFLAGRNLGWITIGLSIFATNISSEHFVGLAGSGAMKGLAVGQFELMAIFILIILGWILSPIYIKSGVTTMPEFLEKRFDRRSRKFFTVLSLLIYILTKITVTLFAGGMLFNKIFGLNIYTSTIVIVLITGLYSVIGGATSVSRTHVFQAIVMILGAVILTIFGLNEVGGFAGLQEKLPAHYFNMFKPMSDPDFPWTGIIFGAPIIAFWYWCTDQYFVQRILSAKSINDARRGSLLAAILKVLPIFILVLPGLIAAALFPEVRGDEAYPFLLASDILPIGLKGLVVAGLLAAIMSSLASVFNTSATLFTNDFYKPKHPEVTERKLILVGRLATTAFVVAGILSVPLIKIIGSQLYLYLQSVQACVSPPITAVFLFGLIVKSATPRAAIWTLAIGELIGLSRLMVDFLVNSGYVTNQFLLYYAGINFLHFAIFLFVICSGLMLVISFAEHRAGSVYTGNIHYMFSDSISEIKLNLFNPLSSGGYKANLYLSGVIILIIIGLWTIWY